MLFLTGETSSLGRSRPVHFSTYLSSFGKVWSLFTLATVCWYYLLPSRGKRRRRRKRKRKRNERRKEHLYNTQFTLHAENSERFSVDLDFSLWTRVTLTFIYEDIIITALNDISAGRFAFTITKEIREILEIVNGL